MVVVIIIIGIIGIGISASIIIITITIVTIRNILISVVTNTIIVTTKQLGEIQD